MVEVCFFGETYLFEFCNFSRRVISKMSEKCDILLARINPSAPGSVFIRPSFSFSVHDGGHDIVPRTWNDYIVKYHN
jgi:hypothetical protein